MPRTSLVLNAKHCLYNLTQPALVYWAVIDKDIGVVMSRYGGAQPIEIDRLIGVDGQNVF